MGFETVVRPAVFPNIRPTPSQSLPPEDDPDKGFAIIRGQPASAVDVTMTMTSTATRSFPTEESRVVDVARVYQMDDDGNVNPDNFIDMDVPTRINMDTGPARGKEQWKFRAPQDSENVEVRERSIRRDQGFVD